MIAATKILIVIVNYRTPVLTLECLASLRPSLAQYPLAQIALVENGSGDGSAEQLRASPLLRELGHRIRLYPLSDNGGYAVGNNTAIRPALVSANPPDYIWLLNSDTLPHPDALPALIIHLETHPRAGIAGSRLEGLDGQPQRSAFRFPSIPGEWEAAVRWGRMTQHLQRWIVAPPVPQTAVQTDWVPGASMLLRRAVLEQIGLLDERFFMYFEDVDLAYRARAAGWEAWYVPASCVVHRVGAGVSGSRYVFASRQAFYLKHYGRLYSMGANLARLLGETLWVIRHPLVRRQDSASFRTRLECDPNGPANE